MGGTHVDRRGHSIVIVKDEVRTNRDPNHLPGLIK